MDQKELFKEVADKLSAEFYNRLHEAMKEMFDEAIAAGFVSGHALYCLGSASAAFARGLSEATLRDISDERREEDKVQLLESFLKGWNYEMYDIHPEQQATPVVPVVPKKHLH